MPKNRNSKRDVLFVPDIKSFSYEELRDLLKDKVKPPKDGGYYKVKIAVFDPQNKEHHFNIRCDVGDPDYWELENCMLY